MLASPRGDTVPEGEGLVYEPKWDGFRALVFRDGDDIAIQGRGGDDLAYAFPEVVDACRTRLPPEVVLDGELVIANGPWLDFEALGARLRPRSEAGGPSIAALARDTPATYVAFDLLAVGDDILLDEPLSARQARLDQLLGLTGRSLSDNSVVVSPRTTDPAVARSWFDTLESAGLDGVIVKDAAAAYAPGKRTQGKVKHRRTADVVVAGFRPHASDGQVGSLLLGLYDDRGVLHHIGVASGFSAKRRGEMTHALATWTADPADPHPWLQPEDGTRVPGGVNRWSRGRDATWTPVRHGLVAEVAYDQMEGDRLRHVATFLRWRPDRDPASCGYAQLQVPVPGADVRTLLGG